ncbi:MAG TPA: methyltransferase domain-containing protein [Casimicrobiaceae bacterium]|nr:methyltransferase domain-containing protein [Casimicrobiaceae bacterium]
MTSEHNAAQIAEWNGVQGERWAALQRETDGIVLPFGEAALAVAAPKTGERVVDVGCGCGDTTIELARRVGEDGSVLGVDVSRPMLDAARRHPAAAGLPQLAFRECDASAAELPAPIDLLYSRFGTMFFDDPVAAFTHMRRSLRPDGRTVFVCWRAPRDNPWAMVPLSAARAAVGVTPPAADPNAPGPFAFADDARVRGILADAGFRDIDIRRFDANVSLGPTPRDAAEMTTRIGPTSRLIRELGVQHVPAITDAIVAALQPFATDEVRVPGSTWIVSARNA